MSDIAARHARLAADFRAAAAAVPPDRWGAPSPCEGWTAHDVVTHVVDAHLMQLGFASAARTMPPMPLRIPSERSTS